MLLSTIKEEFGELKKMFESKDYFESAHLLDSQKEYRSVLLSWGPDMRQLSRMEAILEAKKFKSKAVQIFADTYVECIEQIFRNYDNLTSYAVSGADRISSADLEKSIKEAAKMMSSAIDELNKVAANIDLANLLVSTIMSETWEPLPDNKEENGVNNIIVSSETKSISLNDVSNDVNYLDQFFNNICILINKDKNEDNNIYLRKVETGSLTVAVSCAMGIAEIIAFMFFCVQLCQDTARKSLNNEKERLNNEEKKLKLVNDSMKIAKEILKIDPDNKEADEAIQRCGVHLLNFLENNPAGTINGKHYDTGIEKLKIEDKEKNE